MPRTRQILMPLAAVAIAAGTLAATTPAAVAAEAVACGVSALDRDRRQNGQYFTQDVYLRTGPAWSCGITGSATTANYVDYHCTTAGFTYLRTASTKLGWVHNSYLVGGGTNVRC
ncbi:MULTISPECIES: hypothetical protein [Streptomyces]|nr:MULTISPECIES: hypothetical protein [Streptomyces]UUS34500.1 hypothetical protein NRO40_29225 [Streptomyces changanensis]